jgi:hypothetical protein
MGIMVLQHYALDVKLMISTMDIDVHQLVCGFCNALNSGGGRETGGNSNECMVNVA